MDPGIVDVLRSHQSKSERSLDSSSSHLPVGTRLLMADCHGGLISVGAGAAASFADAEAKVLVLGKDEIPELGAGLASSLVGTKPRKV